MRLQTKRTGSRLPGYTDTTATGGTTTQAGMIPHLGATGLLSGTFTMVYTVAGVPVDYTDGTPPATGEGVTEKGSIVIDTTNANLYVNAGTKAQPIWKLVTRAA